jgi:tetratricopeptide (TPR) repeat protein
LNDIQKPGFFKKPGFFLDNEPHPDYRCEKAVNTVGETYRAGIGENIALIVIAFIFLGCFIHLWSAPVRQLLRARGLRLLRAGNRLLRDRDFGGAIAKYTESIAKHPSLVEAYLGRSSAYIEMGDTEKAFSDCNRVIELDDRNHSAYLNRGSVHRINQEHEQSVADFSQCIKLQPDCAEARFNRGYVLMELDRYDGALEDLSNVILLNPSDAHAHYYRARIYYKNNRFNEVAVDLSNAIDLGLKSAVTYKFRAHANSQTGEFEKALSDYKSALQHAPDDAEALNGLAWFLATCPIPHLRDGARAVEAATRSCELYKYAEWFCVGTLAAAFAETNRFDEAINWAAKSLQLAPDEEKQACSERLKLYESNQPYRIPH